MRKTWKLSAAILLVGIFCCAAGAQNSSAQQRNKPNAPPPAKAANAAESANAKRAEEVAATADLKPGEKPAVGQLLTEKRTAEQAAICKMGDSFQEAYGQGNAKAAAALFTEDAEYVDELGNVFQGRDAIEASLTEFFAENPGCTLKLEIDTIRFVSPGVAVEDGSSTVTCAESPASVDSRYTTMYVKVDGKWHIASLRAQEPKYRRLHRSQLQQLEWLCGDWVDEGDESIVVFSCKPVDNGNFLLRTFTIQIAGQEAMSGTQRIGWDPLTGKLRAWIFDSEGGYGEGLWHRDGENWVLKSIGVTADGQTASSTSIYTFVNAHTMRWQSVDHEISGVQQPDSEVVTIVRQSPAPSTDVAADPELAD